MVGRALLLAVTALAAASCGGDGVPAAPPAAGSITVYSGREKDLAEPLYEMAEQATGLTIEVRYGDSAELAALVLEEGARSPADVFFAQDAGALGALAAKGRLTTLDRAVLARVPERFRATDGSWIGTSGRARTVVYNTDRVSPASLPSSILDFTDPRWRGRIGWAPQNASFQAFVTGFRLLQGDAAARRWLRGMRANGAQDYPKNAPIVEAVGRGEIDVGFVNHYYLLRLKAENPSLPAENRFMTGGDPGALVNVAGAGILRSSKRQDAARRLVEYLVSPAAQRFFAEETFEFPLVRGVRQAQGLPPLEELETPDLDLARLADLEATLAMLREEGLL